MQGMSRNCPAQLLVVDDGRLSEISSHAGSARRDSVAMFTSKYARIKKIPTELHAVGISIKPSYWYRGSKDLRMAPTAEMLKMSPAEYDAIFLGEILPAIDTRQIFGELGDNAVLLCYESPNVWCHRRPVAEWQERSLSVVIPELGFDRSFSLSFTDTPEKADKSAAAK
jgi:hypothetical protein